MSDLSSEQLRHRVAFGSHQPRETNYAKLSLSQRLALQAAERDALARMTSQERLFAYREGRLTRYQRSVWAALYPDETPRRPSPSTSIVTAEPDEDGTWDAVPSTPTFGEHAYIVATLADFDRR